MSDARNLNKSNPLQLRVGERRLLLFVGDFSAAVVALGVALYFWASHDKWLGFSLEFLERRPPIWYFFLPFIWLVLLVELYDMHRVGSRGFTLRNVAISAVIGLSLYFLIYFSSQPKSLPRIGVASFFIVAALLTIAWRFLYIRLFTDQQFMRRVLLVGGGQTGKILCKVISNIFPPPFVLAGIVDDDPQKLNTIVEGVPVIGTSKQLLEIISSEKIFDVIVAITGEMRGSMFQALLDVHKFGVDISRMPVVYEELLGRVPIAVLEADWMIRAFLDEARVSGFYELAKRLLDILGGLIGTLLFTLAFPFVAIAILLDDGKPVFYTQTRSGRGGKPYSILKFRTMRRDAEADGVPQWAQERDERAIRVGLFLRKTHLDELPQFLNVLRGDMSLVGPRAERPELVTMFEQHVPFYRARLLVKPGITGWAQINFGYASNVEETKVKLEYDLYYIKHRSIITDIIILLRTPATVFGFRGR